MKKSLLILLAVILGSSACAPVYGPPVYGPGPVYGAQPIVRSSYVVAVGDRPYYNRGPYYVSRGARYVWVPGHWSHRHGRRVWIHGKYVVRR